MIGLKPTNVASAGISLPDIGYDQAQRKVQGGIAPPDFLTDWSLVTRHGSLVFSEQRPATAAGKHEFP